ncbi:hypothetical protein QE152_g1221 [Popillia japonica]|uniref:NADH dehydrogenase [ubiquinone] 1 alpha subcomplex subunit 11 n=1 Tax=Popillia japonica TaxID=7064 RepID=A0AAW1NA05_POPJA
MAESKPYHYFDTPEGEDIFKKLMVVLKPVALTGIAASTVNVLCFPTAKTYLEVFGKYAYFTLPLVGAASAFVIISNLGVNYRQKDDKLNWVAGALASGAIVGAWTRSTQAGSFACLTFTIAAVLKKHAVQNGWSIIPEENHNPIFASVHGPRYDWTLTKERPRNWTSGEN